jgi:hypothetical protein
MVGKDLGAPGLLERMDLLPGLLFVCTYPAMPDECRHVILGADRGALSARAGCGVVNGLSALP